jgi:hypothetical protein
MGWGEKFIDETLNDYKEKCDTLLEHDLGKVHDFIKNMRRQIEQKGYLTDNQKTAIDNIWDVHKQNEPDINMNNGYNPDFQY